MGFRYRKSFTKGPVRVNLSKSGVGYSVGGKGFRVTKKATGGTRTTATIPGTGISYYSDSKKSKTSRSDAPAPNNAPAGCCGCLTFLMIPAVIALCSIHWLMIPLLIIIAALVYLFTSNDEDDESPEQFPAIQEEEETAETEAPTVSGQADPKDVKCKTYKVAGVAHYAENVEELGIENEDYFKTKRELMDEDLTDERIWKYQFFPEKVELIPEPENPHDPNAIKVLVDDTHVGYIKHGSCAHVLKLLREESVIDIDCTIGGGPYKIVFQEYDEEREKEVYVQEKDERPFFVHLQITEK